MHHTLMQTYSPLPIELTHGEGAWVWDTSGKKYLDALAGIAVTNIGHAHPKLVKTISEQAGKILHTSNILTIPQQNLLADKLCELTKMERVFFGNSGAEANECALKIARILGHNRGIDIPTTIVMENAFHGRTLGTLTASGSRKVQAGFEPLVQGFCRAPFNDLDALRSIGKNNPNIVAIFVEPVQGESGINVPDEAYLKGVRAICDEHNWVMMLDEVQTGVGRTGKWFAYQHSDILPDVVTSAKALGNGIPIGACLARGEAAEVLKIGNHGSTYGGNPLSCAAASTVLEVIESEGLVENSERMGSYLKSQLQERLGSLEAVKEVRGQGLMIGVDLGKPCRELLALGAEAGLLFSIAGGNSIRLVPPLTINQSEADYIVDVLAKIIPVFAAL